MKKEIVFWGLLLLLILFRFVSTRPNYSDGDRVRISSKVLSEPVRFERVQYIKLFGLKTYLPLFPEISYGDSVVVEGVVAGDKLEDVKLIDHFPSKGFVYSFRKKLVDFYKKSLPGEHAGLIAGVVVGSKEAISSAFWEKLVATGTAHVVVASGMNVSLVGMFLLYVLLTFLPRRKAVIGSLIGIWFYAFLSGMDAPIIRSAIMGSLAFSAIALGRLNLSLRALFLSAAFMLLVKPDWVADMGFILSFVATLSLILFERKVYRLVHFVPAIIREDLSTTLAAQIGVAPVLYAAFGQFNLLSPLINALVIWTIPIITIVGMIAGLVGVVLPGIGKLILFLIYPLTKYFVLIVGAFK